MHTVKLFERAATGAVHAVRHPISSAAYAVGIVRGLAGAALHVATVDGRDSDAGPRTQPHHVPTQRRAPAAEVDDVPAPEPTPLHQASATEPTAVSRASEHGRASDAEIDAWIDQAMDGLDPDTDAVGAVLDLPQAGTGPLLDPGTAKAIRSESEILRKGAERNPE